MNNSGPSYKIIFVFVLSSLVSYSLINFFIYQVDRREQIVHKEAAHILQQEIVNRFDLALDVTLVIGQMSSKYFFKRDTNDLRYEELIHKVLSDKEYIIGLNQHDTSGKIVGIYPEEGNQEAIGRVTANYAEVVKSYQRGEKFWFSPPIKLFQGGSGFIFYIPIEENDKLVGWMSPVISSQQFLEHFRTMKFFDEYDLIIKDGLTGKIYFETGIPDENEKIEETRSRIQKRDISFLTWPKDNIKKFNLSFTWRFLICLFTGFFFALVMKIYLQKKKAYSRLENISSLLKLTSDETLTKLMDIQTEYLSIGSNGLLNTDIVEKDVQSISNLIEQLELLQNMAISDEMDEDSFEVLPLLTDQKEVLRDVINKKNLEFNIDIQSFEGVKIIGNKWLISNTVIKNAMSYIVLIACPRGKIDITHTKTTTDCSSIFHIDKVYEEEAYKALRIERRLLVARNVMDLLKGEIIINKNGSGGLTFKLTIPINASNT